MVLHMDRFDLSALDFTDYIRILKHNHSTSGTCERANATPVAVDSGANPHLEVGVA